ncbi:MAG: hypothetical protein OXE50_13940, partial [Chloroflexi bacterium]|nr:hypothetical protein [Chloroflexota bacterium]
MPEQSNNDRHRSRGEAEIAFRKAVAALARDPDVREGQIAWLRQQRPVAIDAHNCVLLAYPSDVEARLASSTEAMVRLDNKLREEGLATGVSVAVSLSRNPSPSQGVAAVQRAVS